MIRIERGNLLDSDAKFICHQVNCKGTMGSGIAKQIANRWPAVKSEYEKLCKSAEFPEMLAGRHQLIKVRDDPEQFVCNIFGQVDYGRNKKIIYTSYGALTKAFYDLRDELEPGTSIAFPFGFGCGLANGDWLTVESMIIEILGDFDVRIHKI